ncbi:Annexin A9 [Manis javanica]|nr:Annexin A9 [Manis javanica]
MSPQEHIHQLSVPADLKIPGETLRVKGRQQGSHVCDQQEDETIQNPGDPQPPGHCRQDCSLRDAGHPPDLLELQCGQEHAEAAEGHCRPRPCLGSAQLKAQNVLVQGNHKAIVGVLSSRSREQRQLLSQAFQGCTQEDLLKSLQAALSGNLEKIMVALLQPAAHFDAEYLRTPLKLPELRFC